MCRPTPPVLTIALLFGCALISPPELAAQGPVASAAPATGIHVVRDGETLEGIAAYYLGSAGRWREIWEHNKDDIANPDLIYPGYKLKVPVPEKLPAQAAVVTTLARRVEDQRRPLPFEPARKNDLLQPLDVLQTYEAASAEIRFGDETSLVVTEQSRIILGKDARARAPVDRQQIEIVVGQADLESVAAPGSGLDFEIVMGNAVVTPRPGAGGEPVQARTRKPEGAGAQLMVYKGGGDLEAGGQKVDVPQGMGTKVAEGGTPAPPEKLLDPPRVVRPEAGSRWDVPDPTFEWEPVAGAEAYTLEVCRDPKCGELEVRVTDLRVNAWRPESLPIAAYFWRITARSPSGLDGYPSSATDFAVVDHKIDRTAPVAAVSFLGPQVGVNDRLIVGVGAEIRAAVSDDETGVESWVRLVDGEEVAEDGWRSPWASGTHQVSVRATDRAGNVATLEPVPFIYDPDPPVISWGLEKGPASGQAVGETATLDPLDEKRSFGFWAQTTGSSRSPLVWTSSELKWLPMGYQEWKISSDKPFIVVRPRKKKPLAFPSIGDLTITRDRGLWIHAVDAGCGVEHMTYQLLVGPDDALALVVEAVDALDNKSRVVWPLARR